MKTQTKPGKYGTLYRFELTYRDSCDEFNTGIQSVWAYDVEHAIEKFYDAPDADCGWELVSVSVNVVRS